MFGVSVGVAAPDKPFSARKLHSQFALDEDGGITIFVLVFFILLMLVGGMAVDWQRYEMARADLQDALDRGVLAATNSNQIYDTSGGAPLSVDEQAAELVGQYLLSRNFYSAGLTYSASVTDLPGGRLVTASAQQPLDTVFLRLGGWNRLNVSVASGATQSANRIEIVLVLDITESMAWNSTSAPGSKISQLKVAAKQFLDTVLTPDLADRTLISIVPFSQNVALPRWMADLYSINRHHDYSSCIDFHDLNFDSVAMPMSPSSPYTQAQHFRENAGGIPAGRYGCSKNPNNVTTPFSNDLTQLKAAIDALSTESFTAMYMGMKWGAALLDTSSRPIVDDLIARNNLPSSFAGWPRDWNDPSVRKITVLMSDGQNTRLHEIRDLIYPTQTPAWWDANNPLPGSKYSVIDNNRPGPFGGQGDTILKAICDKAKIGSSSTVYTIGFELSGNASAQAALSDCASSAATYYLVEGVEITTAFQNIAAEIVKLKLVN